MPLSRVASHDLLATKSAHTLPPVIFMKCVPIYPLKNDGGILANIQSHKSTQLQQMTEFPVKNTILHLTHMLPVNTRPHADAQGNAPAD
jgi:hypothetical protein